MSTGLTRRQLWFVLAVALVVFALGAGPVWRDPWSIDESILVSYLVIPPLVLAVLLLSRRFTWRDLALDTLTVVAAKFGVTYVAAAVMWALSGEPPPLSRPPPPRFPAAPVAPAPGVAPSEASALEGVVTEAGAPRAGVLVWVASGLEARSFPVRDDVVEVVDDGRGFAPSAAAAQAGQPLRLRSGDGQMHAVRAADERGRTVFNVAATSGGATIRPREPAGLVSLRCAVHSHAGKERPGALVLLAHPFFATTDAGGRFRFEGLPPGRVVLRALDAELREARQVVEVPAPRPVSLAFGAAAAPAR